MVSQGNRTEEAIMERAKKVPVIFRFRSFAAATIAIAATSAVPVMGQASYDKEIYFDDDAGSVNSAKSLPIMGGASVDTFFTPFNTNPALIYWQVGNPAGGGATKAVPFPNSPFPGAPPALGPNSLFNFIGAQTPTLLPFLPGQPIMFNGNPYPFQSPPNAVPNPNNGDGAGAVNLNTGWSPPQDKYTDTRTNPSEADATIKVDPWVDGSAPAPIIVKNGKPITPFNYNHASLVGNAMAGVPAKPPSGNPDNAHSAVSLSIIQLGGDTYTANGNKGPFVQVLGGGTITGGTSATAKRNAKALGGGVIDPIYLSVNNVTNPSSPVTTAQQEVMEEDGVYTGDASFQADDTGITLTMDTSDPTASASVIFQTVGSWVTNPYSYGATLTPSGLTGIGITPTSDWSMTTNGSIVTETLLWSTLGIGSGLPFDEANVQPDSSAFPTSGDTYQDDVTDSDLGYDYVVVPEPIALSVVAIMGCLALQRRWKR